MSERSDPVASFRLVSPEGFPHGLRCRACDRSIGNWQPFGSALESMVDDATVSLLLCVYCIGSDK